MSKILINHKPIFTLSHVVNETGVKADTLRAWERRYQLPQPTRSEGNQRLYSDHDIETIKWLVHQKKNGMTISKAVALWTELENQGKNPLSDGTGRISIIRQPILKGEGAVLLSAKHHWIDACLHFNEASAEQVLMQAFARFSMEIVVTQILQTGLSDIGSLWHQGTATVQQEHFASQLALRKLHTLISSAPLPTRNKTILIACPEGENHTFASLLIALFLRYAGWHVVDIGASVPTTQMDAALHTIKPDLVVMIAMRLATAASLYDTALLLNKLQIQLAFGGWVFNQVPGLAQRIPGYFLGEELSNTVGIVETIFTKPRVNIVFKLPQNDLTHLAQLFNEKEFEINQRMLSYFEEKPNLRIDHDQIVEANSYLSQDITAALTLGDINLVSFNLTWLINLLKNRGFSDELAVAYLFAYRETVNTFFGNDGSTISNVFNNVLVNKYTNNTF